jgi:heat shock protein HslJ
MSGQQVKTLYVLFFVAFFVMACAGKKDVAMTADVKAGLVGKQWVAEYILGVPVVDMSHSNIGFMEDGTVKGRGGCNSYMGSYALNGNEISFGPMAATMLLCGDALDDQEMRFFQSLAVPLTVKTENGLLYLAPDEGNPSIFAVQD